MNKTENSAERPYRLPDGLPADAYEMPGTLANAADWKARVWDGNCGDERSQVQSICYVMISVKDNTIIPISRGDEHHQGYETLREHSDEWGIRSRDYVPIPAVGSAVYIYSASDIPLYLEALKRFRSYGGQNVPINSNPQDGLPEQIILADDFLKTGGLIPLDPGKLWPYGERLMRAFEALSDALDKARGVRDERSVQGVFKAAWRLRDTVAANWLGVIHHLDAFTRFRQGGEFTPQCVDRMLATWEANDDIAALEDAVFGFGDDWVGLKSSMHRDVRRELDGERIYSKVKPIFGDLEFANDRFGRVGWKPSEDPEADVGLRM